MGADNTFGETNFNPNKWTPEPWIESLAYGYVCLPFEDHCRAVECVNALAGVENPNQFVRIGKKYIEQDRDIRRLVNADHNEDTLDVIGDLMRQREELAEQVEKLKVMLGDATDLIDRLQENNIN